MTSKAPPKAGTLQGITPAQRQEIKEVFSLFADDKNRMDPKELRVAMRALGIDVSKETAVTVGLHLQDPDDSNLIPFSAFEQEVANYLIKRDPKDEIAKAFEMFADPSTGKITKASLRAVAKELAEQISEEELNEMINEAASNGANEVGLEDFVAIMSATRLYGGGA